MQLAGEALERCDATIGSAFSWLCRIGGSVRAEALLPEVYRLANRPPGHFDDDWLLATAFELTVADEAVQASAADELVLSILDRALIELRGGRGRSVDDVASIVARPVADIPALVDDAERRAVAMYPDTSFAEIGQMREVWLDDDTRARCRAAISGSIASGGADGETAATARLAARRSRAAVAAGILAVLVVGIVWVLSDDGSSPSPGNETVVSISPFVTTGYVLGDLPEGFAAVGASAIAAAPDAVAAPGQLQLWATPDAQRTSGRWFAVVTARCASIDPTITPESGTLKGGTAESGDAMRVDVNGNSGLITTEADGVVDLRVQSGTNELTSRTLAIKGFGLTIEELRAIGSSVLLDSNVKDPTELTRPSCDGAQPDVVTEFDSRFNALHYGMDRVVTVPWYGAAAISADQDGSAQRIVEYRSEMSRIVVTRRATGSNRPVLSQLLQPASADSDAPDDPQRRTSVGDRAVTVSATVKADGSLGDNVIELNRDGDTVEITSPLALDTLLPLVSSLRPATGDEWAVLLDAGLQASPAIGDEPSSAPAPTAAPMYGVGTYTTAKGTTWQMLVGIDPDVLQLEDPERGTVFQDSFPFDGLPPVHTYFTVDTTLVVVSLTDPNTGLGVRVNVGGADLAPSALQQAVDGGSFAIVAFNETGPYTVNLVDETGRVIRQLSARG